MSEVIKSDRGFGRIELVDATGSKFKISDRSVSPLNPMIAIYVKDSVVFGAGARVLPKDELENIGVESVMACIDLNKELAGDLVKVLNNFIETGKVGGLQ